MLMYFESIQILCTPTYAQSLKNYFISTYIEYEIGKLKYRKLNTLVEFIGYMQQVYLNNSAN